MSFRSGFTSIIGKPNSGKSTLLNALLGEKISAVTSKAQTTRHRIKGILTGKDYQVVFSDTPGVITAKYELHKSMMKTVAESLEDADVLLVLLDPTSDLSEAEELATRIREVKIPMVIAVNKSDAIHKEKLDAFIVQCSRLFPGSEILALSALKNHNLDVLLEAILQHLPQQDAFYSGDELTDRTERFIATELIREKIFGQFQKEVPYSCEVLIQDWKEEPDITHIRAEIIVERESQKGIILGKGGSAIKNLGILARRDIETLLGKKIFLGLTVKVNPNWRNSLSQLKYFGYSK